MAGAAAHAGLDVLRAEPGRSAVLTDFDGTLAPIVSDPATSRPLAGAAEALSALTARYGLVGVVSGRPVAFLEPFFPAEVVLIGLYGLETIVDGQRRDHAGTEEWRPVVAGVVARAAAEGPPGMPVEDKGLSVTVHYRTRPELADAVAAWAEGEAVRTGLELRRAKKSFELHPPLAVDKGTVVHDLAAGFAAACFIGDDLGDLTAFDALDRLAAAGTATVRVGVHGPEGEPSLLERADVVVDGPAGVLALLRELGRS